jgi:hypothetical protein
MNSTKLLPTIEAIVAAVSFASIFLAGLMGRVAVRFGMDETTAGVWTRCIILLLFVVFGFACIGLLVHLFVVLQIRIGNREASMVRFLAQHETGVTLAFWGFLGLGTLVALPFALHDIAGVDFRMPLRSRGVLVADIGMTVAEVRRNSTLPVKEPLDMGDGSTRASEDVVFDFRIANSAVHFPLSRYYSLRTGRNRDGRIADLNIGITPQKMPKPELEAFRHRVQSQLLADGWMPGHRIADSEETIHMWGGHRTTGDGRYWGKAGTLLIIETNRMDEEQRDEPPGAGQFILYLVLESRSDNKDLVYEPSAWSNQ